MDKNSTQKKAPLVFSNQKKEEKKCPSSSSPLLRPPTACTSATSRGRPPSRSYKRCSRTRRASRSQPCVSSWSSFVVALLVFFLFRVVSLFWRTQSALCRKERRHDGDQNRDCADSFDDKKNNDDGFAHPIVAEGSTRRHVAGPPSLSLSTGDDDDDVNDESPKSEEKDGTSRVDDFGFCTTLGKQKGTVVRAFAFVVVESPKKEKEKSLTFEFRERALVEASFVIFFSPPYKMSSSSSDCYYYYYCY